MTKLYLCRHGETELNERKVYYGWLDAVLSEKGNISCKGLHEKLRDVSFDVVISSTLDRAVNSAHIISGLNMPEIICHEDLRELNFGEWEGLHFTEIEERYRSEWNDYLQDWQSFIMPGGEDFTTFYNRVKKCIQDILHEHEGKTILLVAHDGTLKVISTVLLNLQPSFLWQFAFEFGCYSLFEIQGDLAVIKKINC